MRFKLFSCHTVLVCALFLILIGCSSKTTEVYNRPSKDGHPPSHMIPKHLDKIPDAVPKVEPLSRYGNRFKKNTTNTYVALKKKYAVMPSSRGYKARGQASWYGTKFQGKKTSSGEPYDMFAMTAAHRTLPLPTYAKVTNVDTGKSIIVKVNDRGPFHNNRLIDLSYVAAHKLGIVGHGTGRVEVESIDPRDHHGRVKNSKGRSKNRLIADADAEKNLNDMTIQASNKMQTRNDTQAMVMPETKKTAEVKKTVETKKIVEIKESAEMKRITGITKSAEVKTTADIKKTGKIFLQLGSFNQKNNAEDLARKLGQLTHEPSKIAENNTQVGAKYRVRIGPFKNREAALALSQKLAKENLPKSIVLTE
jgi:rare lipoprotein A